MGELVVLLLLVTLPQGGSQGDHCLEGVEEGGRDLPHSRHFVEGADIWLEPKDHHAAEGLEGEHATRKAGWRREGGG